MPVKSTLGALKLQLPSANPLVTPYWINLVEAGFSSGFYDSSDYYFITDSKILVQLNDRNETISTVAYQGTGLESIPSGAFTRMIKVPPALGYSDKFYFGIDFAQNYGIGELFDGPSAAGFKTSTPPGGSMLFGNSCIDEDGNKFVVGQQQNGYGHITVSGGPGGFYTKFLDKPPLNPFNPRKIFVHVKDVISDGTNYYVAGRFREFQGAGRGGFLIKLNLNGNIIWQVNVEEAAFISFIDNNQNIICVSNNTSISSKHIFTVRKIDLNGNSLGRALISNTDGTSNKLITANCLNVTDNKILVGGIYTAPIQQHGFMVSLNSDLSLIYKNKISSTMPPGATQPVMTVKSCHQDFSQNAHYFTMRNTNNTTAFGLSLKTPSDGTILGNGVYQTGSYVTTYSTNNDLTHQTDVGGTSISNLFFVSDTISFRGFARVWNNFSTPPISKTSINT